MRIYLLLGGGEPWASSPAFLFPRPKATFIRSPGTGVPACEVGSTTADEMREKPALGAGEAEVEPTGLTPFEVKCNCGAGTVMKPASGTCGPTLLSFFFLFFSVLPLASG